MQHFDLCVIGSGSGNSLIDERFDGRRVALVDDGARFGGTCLNHGCIPTKMFVYPADLCRVPEEAGRVGVTMGAAKADFPAIRDRIFGRIDPISDAGEDWRRMSGTVTLFRETARFTGPKTLHVGEETITADQFVIAAGSRPKRPDIPGADDPALADRIHTSDDIMRLEALPASLIIVGGGFIAAEFAHIFSSFGTSVTLIARGDRLLKREDLEISRRYTELAATQVNLRLGQQLRAIEEGSRGRLSVSTADANGDEYDFEGERILLALGRASNADRLDVAAAGVAVDDDGFVVTDAYQRTSAEGVWALGDVSSHYQLKHVANHEARTVQHNLLHPDDLRESDRRFVPPHGVFGRPPIASVGLSEDEARERGLDVVTSLQEYFTVAYGWAMEDVSHCVKLVADRGTRQILGAHILGPEASVLIQPLIQAMSFGLAADEMGRGQYWIHPSLSEVVENALLALDFDGATA